MDMNKLELLYTAVQLVLYTNISISLKYFSGLFIVFVLRHRIIIQPFIKVYVKYTLADEVIILLTKIMKHSLESPLC